MVTAYILVYLSVVSVVLTLSNTHGYCIFSCVSQCCVRSPNSMVTACILGPHVLFVQVYVVTVDLTTSNIHGYWYRAYF